VRALISVRAATRNTCSAAVLFGGAKTLRITCIEVLRANTFIKGKLWSQLPRASAHASWRVARRGMSLPRNERAPSKHRRGILANTHGIA